MSDNDRIIEKLEKYLENADVEVNKLTNWVVQLCIRQHFIAPIIKIVEDAKEGGKP